jgi:hypothetical protein
LQKIQDTRRNPLPELKAKEKERTERGSGEKRKFCGIFLSNKVETKLHIT